MTLGMGQQHHTACNLPKGLSQLELSGFCGQLLILFGSVHLSQYGRDSSSYSSGMHVLSRSTYRTHLCSETLYPHAAVRITFTACETPFITALKPGLLSSSISSRRSFKMTQCSYFLMYQFCQND